MSSAHHLSTDTFIIIILPSQVFSKMMALPLNPTPLLHLFRNPDRNSRPDRAPKTYQWDVWYMLKYITSKIGPF